MKSDSLLKVWSQNIELFGDHQDWCSQGLKNIVANKCITLGISKETSQRKLLTSRLLTTQLLQITRHYIDQKQIVNRSLQVDK